MRATVSIDVNVFDQAALLQRARQHFLDINPNQDEEDAASVVTDVRSALLELLDWGAVPVDCGFEITDSDCEVA